MQPPLWLQSSASASAGPSGVSIDTRTQTTNAAPPSQARPRSPRSPEFLPQPLRPPPPVPWCVPAAYLPLLARGVIDCINRLRCRSSTTLLSLVLNFVVFFAACHAPLLLNSNSPRSHPSPNNSTFPLRPRRPAAPTPLRRQPPTRPPHCPPVPAPFPFPPPPAPALPWCGA